MTSQLKVDRISPATGSEIIIDGFEAPAASVKAWVQFNGNVGGGLIIQDEMNVSSVTDNGVGSYWVNYKTAMPDNKYCALVTKRNDVTNRGFCLQVPQVHPTYLTIQTYEDDAPADSSVVSCAVLN